MTISLHNGSKGNNLNLRTGRGDPELGLICESKGTHVRIQTIRLQAAAVVQAAWQVGN